MIRDDGGKEEFSLLEVCGVAEGMEGVDDVLRTGAGEAGDGGGGFIVFRLFMI